MSKVLISSGGQYVPSWHVLGCCTDDGFPPCAGRVAYVGVRPLTPEARSMNPDLKDSVVLVGKCRKHWKEVRSMGHWEPVPR